MKQIVLEVEKRETSGKMPAKEFRSNGLVPAIIFGKKRESLSLLVDARSLEKVLHQGAAHKIVSLQIKSNEASDEKMCVIQELQRDAFGMKVIHVDFHEISMEEKITSKIPLELQGTPPGAKEGGILDHVLWEVEVRSLPLNLPEKLTIDISELMINQSLHVRDIRAPEHVEILDDPNEVVVVVHPPRVEEVPVAAAAPVEGAPAATPAPAAQPEVISKGKKEEEAAEEKPKK